MKNSLLLILFLINTGAFAQECGMSPRYGKGNHYAHIQFGDTIVVNVPYKAKDKIGMDIFFREDYDGPVSTSVQIRSISPVLLKDSIYLEQWVFRVYLKNGDTVNFVPDKRYKNNYRQGVIKALGAIAIYFPTHLSYDQLLRLDKSRLDKICFYKDANTFEDLPVSRHERQEFKYAVIYMLRNGSVLVKAR